MAASNIKNGITGPGSFLPGLCYVGPAAKYMLYKLEFIEQFDRTVGGGAHDAPFPFWGSMHQKRNKNGITTEKYAHRVPVFPAGRRGRRPLQ